MHCKNAVRIWRKHVLQEVRHFNAFISFHFTSFTRSRLVLTCACNALGMDPDRYLTNAVAHAPPGYPSWIPGNLSSSSYNNPPNDGNNRLLLESSLPYGGSFRCDDDRCSHFIYGFASQAELNQHCLAAHRSPPPHTSASTSAEPSAQTLRISNPFGPSFSPPLATQSHNSNHNPHSPTEDRRQASLAGSDYTRHAVHPALPPFKSLSSSVSAGHCQQLPQSQSQESPHYAPIGPDRRRSADDGEPVLPPLEIGRVGQPRLESIGQLRLFDKNKRCLRCRVSNKEVSQRPHVPLPYIHKPPRRC